MSVHRLIAVLALLVCAAPAHSQATDEMMEQCVTALESCEVKAGELDKQVKSLEAYRQTCDAQIANIQEGEVGELVNALAECSKRINLKDEQIENLIEIDSTLSGDREACYDRLGETMQNYRTCVQEATKPWWQTSMFYLGIALGIAIGAAAS